MRILIATPLYPPETGGPATYTKLLEEGLPSRGMDVVVAKWSVVRGKPRLVRHIAYFWPIFKIGHDVDVIFALDPVSVGLPTWLASTLLRKRFFLKVVGDFAWEQWMQKGRGEFVDVETFQKRRFDVVTELRRFVEHYVARRAERVIVPSEFLKRIVLAWGVPETRIVVVYNSFDPPSTILTKTDARRILGLSGTVIMSAGRLVPWKGMQALVGVMPEILREFPDAKLLIAGDGPEREALALKIARPLTPERSDGGRENCELENSITLLGRLDRETLYQHIAAADLFVLNTGYEGLSHQLLEVMALGTPIVATNVGGNPELIEDGQSGRLVAYGDKEALVRAVVDLLSHPPAGGKFAAAAQKRVDAFGVGRMVEETVRVLNLPARTTVRSGGQS